MTTKNFQEFSVMLIILVGSIGCANGSQNIKDDSNKASNSNISQEHVSIDTVATLLKAIEKANKERKEPIEEHMNLTNKLTLIAILTALLGPFLFAFARRIYLIYHYNRALSAVVSDFIADLERIRRDRNPQAVNATDHINFNPTSRSEMHGYYNIFESLILKNFHLKSNSSDIIFLSHYQKNLKTVDERTSIAANGAIILGWLELATVNRLINFAKDCIR